MKKRNNNTDFPYKREDIDQDYQHKHFVDL
jgi:hypothetical protein